MIFCICGHLLVESESSKQLTNGDWMLSQFRTTSSRMERPHGARHGKTDAQMEHFVAHDARKMSQKEITKEFPIVSYGTQYIVILNSKLAGPRRSASKWIIWRRKTTPTAHPLRSMSDIKNIGTIAEKVLHAVLLCSQQLISDNS